MRRLLLLVIVLGAPAFATPNDAAPATRPTEDPALTRQLEAIDARAAKIKDFAADFRQEKSTTLLKKPLVSDGEVRVSGHVIRWDTRNPEPAVLYSDGKEVRMHYPGQKLLEVYPIDRRLGDLAASPLPRLGTLREHFTLARATDTKSFKPPKGRRVLALRLTPADASLRQHVDVVRVLLDIEAAHILELEIVDADGDRTHVSFTKVRLDTGLRADDLKLDVPPGTTVSRPLDVKDEQDAR